MGKINIFDCDGELSVVTDQTVKKWAFKLLMVL